MRAICTDVCDLQLISSSEAFIQQIAHRNNFSRGASDYIFESFKEVCGLILLTIIMYSSDQPTKVGLLEPEEMRQSLSSLLPPANPIITKPLENYHERVTFKIAPSDSQNRLDFASNSFSSPTRQNKTLAPQDSKPKEMSKISSNQQTTALHEEYRSSCLLYKKFNNDDCNRRDNICYLASIFVKKDCNQSIRLPSYVGTVGDDQLQFESNFQSGNLMLVYKKGSNAYDLLLQNDVNTGGFTQWYNFKVRNKKHNFIARFNIVNLYKSDSLYNKGMKPCVSSAKSNKNNQVSWRRKGFNIYYEHNDLAYEDNPRKHYKTLSFQYDFTVENDTVQFAHSIPYDTDRLRLLLEQIKPNSKVTLQTVGNTCMGRPIPLLKIKGNDANNLQKKVIIIIARQHPGQTVGSHIAEQILLDLLRNSTQSEFILWRYDIYMIPMINMDGVALGNYRSNFAGYDLNRCWEKTDPKFHPEVYAIKSFVRKIRKKHTIELILDLHGHSRKMGSFFYGNNFGKNTMLFPYICSKNNSNILFEESRFSSQRGRKAQTARVVLGKMIRQTGNVYTYEVSFYGNYKNEKQNPFSFNDTHYRQLGKALVLSIYRTYMQLYKQEKTLKESIFLRSIKQEIQEIKANTILDENEDSGSDSEAEEIMASEKQKLQHFYQNQPENEEVLVQSPSKHQDMSRQQLTIDEQRKTTPKKQLNNLLGKAFGREYYDIRNIIKSRFPSVTAQETPQRSEAQLQQQLQYIDNTHNSNCQIRKHGHKLKVYGQTYELRSRFTRSEKDNNEGLPIPDRNQDKTIANKSGINRRTKDLVIQRKQLVRSFNTINYDLPRNISLTKQLRVKEKNQQFRNKSLTLKEVAPLFHDNLTSNSAKINLDRTKIQEKELYNRGMGEYLSRNLKLPHL